MQTTSLNYFRGTQNEKTLINLRGPKKWSFLSKPLANQSKEDSVNRMSFIMLRPNSLIDGSEDHSVDRKACRRD